jgi:chitodextrinase
VKKQYLYVAGAGVAAYVGYRYWRASQDASAAAAAPPPESAGTIGADIGSGAGGYYDPNGSDGIGGSNTVGDVMSTDQQWYAAAMVALQDAAYDTGAAAVALGKYLRTEPLTAAEQDMVKVALAAAGNPPSGAKAIVTGSPPSPSGLTAPQHLRGGGTPTTAAIPLVWDPVSGASGYVVYRGGTQLATVSGTSYTVTGLAAGTSYTHTVRATNSGGTLSPASAGYTAKTAAAGVPVASAPSKALPRTAPKPAAPAIPPYHRRTITPGLRTLSELVADDNRKTGRAHSWQSVWSFNLAHRDEATVAKLKARGPDKVFLGSTFWIPNA